MQCGTVLAALKVHLYSCFPCRTKSQSPSDTSTFASALLLICERSFVNGPRPHRISRTEYISFPLQCQYAKQRSCRHQSQVSAGPKNNSAALLQFPLPSGSRWHLTTCEDSDAQAADATRAESPHPPSAVLSHSGALCAGEKGMNMHPCQLQGTHSQPSLPPTRADPSCPRRKEQADLPRRCCRVPAVPGPCPGQAALLTLPAKSQSITPSPQFLPLLTQPCCQPASCPAALPTSRNLLPAGD